MLIHMCPLKNWEFYTKPGVYINNTKLYKTPGPWNNCPLVFKFQIDGYKCMVKSNHIGALCGYLAIPKGHPFYNLDYDLIDADVHGGLTYAAMDHGNWLIGFDCAHHMDFMVGMYDVSGSKLRHIYEGTTYKNIAFVYTELKRLAQQIKERE